jgi:23S rRNA (cytidine1920-2'-O)/16S rRNA (cytidine1409-2'-O)-methyltransferase
MQNRFLKKDGRTAGFMKERLDVLLVEKEFATSREKAKAMILAGDVFINGQREDKAGSLFDPEKIRSFEVRSNIQKYVSRGGFKLEKAMEVFPLDLKGKNCMDIGASTGGFTDCMLQNGAEKVYSVDVGYGQLDWKLRNDKRVICMEKTNFRYLTPSEIGESLDFASVDVSFISLTKILLPARNLLKNGAQMVCLIKPQFEAGKEKVGKKGVVRDASVHEEVIGRVIDFAGSIGFLIKGLDFSPIKGPEGNIEYLLFLEKDKEQSEQCGELEEHAAIKILQDLQENRTGISLTDEMQKKIIDTVNCAHGSLQVK